MVTSVQFVAGLLDFRAKQREENVLAKVQYNGQSAEDGTGMTWLDNSLEGSTLGYTRKAQAYVGQEAQREYTY